MFEIFYYLIPQHIVPLAVFLSLITFAISTPVLFKKLSVKKWKAVFASAFISLVSLAICVLTFYSVLNPVNVVVSDNPTVHTFSSKTSIKINEDKFTQTVAEELGVKEVKLEGYGGRLLALNLANGEAVEFTSTSDEGVLKGAVNFTDENMIITVFESNEDSIVVPVK